MARGFFKSLDEAVGKSSLPVALRAVMEKGWGKIEVTVSVETKEILKKEAVLVVCSHPYELDVLPVIAAFPARRDLYVVASANYVGLGPNIDKCIIPVFIRHTELQSTKWTVWLGSHLSTKRVLPRELSRVRNRRSMIMVARKLREGAAVVFSPEGPKGKQGGWGKGVGRVVRQLGGRRGIYLIMARVEGITAWDHLRFLPGVGRLFPEIRVNFFETLRVSSLAGRANEAKIISDLRERYYGRFGAVAG